MDLRDRLSIEHPILQAGLGSGLAGAELAAAVSNAGGLGTVGFAPCRAFEDAIERTKSAVEGRSFAANLLVPFARREHVRACVKHKVPIVSLFYGFDAAMIRALREAGTVVLFQVGSVDEAERVVAAGADGLIVQGFEAGGHIRGTERLEALLPGIRERFRAIPVIGAGGIWDRGSVAKARSIGTDGVSCGTRFLLTDESRAHPAYKSRLLEADRTVVTTLFGMGWPAPHRVVPNQASNRWCDGTACRAPGIRALNWVSQFGAKLVPLEQADQMARSQRVHLPVFSPASLTVGMESELIEVTAAYAGECVRDITALMPAARVVEELAKGF